MRPGTLEASVIIPAAVSCHSSSNDGEGGIV